MAAVIHGTAINQLLTGGHSGEVAAFKAQYFPDSSWSSVKAAIDEIIKYIDENYPEHVIYSALIRNDKAQLAKIATLLNAITKTGSSFPKKASRLPAQLSAPVYGEGTTILGRTLAEDLDLCARLLPASAGRTKEGRGSYSADKAGRVLQLVLKYTPVSIVPPAANTTKPIEGAALFRIQVSVPAARAPDPEARSAETTAAASAADAAAAAAAAIAEARRVAAAAATVVDAVSGGGLASSEISASAVAAAAAAAELKAAEEETAQLTRRLAEAQASLRTKRTAHQIATDSRVARDLQGASTDAPPPPSRKRGAAEMTDLTLSTDPDAKKRAMIHDVLLTMMNPQQVINVEQEVVITTTLTRWGKQLDADKAEKGSLVGMFRTAFDKTLRTNRGLSLPFENVPHEAALSMCGHPQDPNYAPRKAALELGWKAILDHQKDGINFVQLLRTQELSMSDRINYLERLGRIDFSLCAIFMTIAMIGTPGSLVMIPDINSLLAPLSGTELVSNVVYNPLVMPPVDWRALVTAVRKAYLTRIATEVSAAKLKKLLASDAAKPAPTVRLDEEQLARLRLAAHAPTPATLSAAGLKQITQALRAAGGTSHALPVISKESANALSQFGGEECANCVWRANNLSMNPTRKARVLASAAGHTTDACAFKFHAYSRKSDDGAPAVAQA